MIEYNQNYENNHGPIYNAENMIITNNNSQNSIQNLPILAGNYKHNLQLFNQIEEKINTKTGKKIVVIGASGFGKSVRLIGWARKTKLEFGMKCFIFTRNGNIFEQLVDFFVQNLSSFIPNFSDQVNFNKKTEDFSNPKEKLKIISQNRGSGKKLLILDDIMPENDVNINELLKNLEGLGFCVIITSHRPKSDFHHAQYDIIELKANQELCMQILADIYGDNQEEKTITEQLCQYVGNNTLAIERIWSLAMTQNEKGQKPTLKQIQEDLKKIKGLKNTKLSKEDQDLFHTDGVYQTLELSWQRLGQKEKDLLNLCGQMELTILPDYWFDVLKKIDSNFKITRWNLVNNYLLDQISDKSWKIHEL